MIVITLRWFNFIYFVRNPHLHLHPCRRPEEERIYAWRTHLNDELQVKRPDAQDVACTWVMRWRSWGVFWECVSIVISSACLPVYYSVWFVGSHSCPRPPQPQPNPPLLTGLSSNMPQDSVSPAVFKIQFRCAIQICFGEQRRRQTHYVKKRKMDTHRLMVLWHVVGRGTPKRSNAITTETPWQTVRFFFSFVLQNLQHVIKRTTHWTADGSEVISPAINILKTFQPIRFF